MRYDGTGDFLDLGDVTSARFLSGDIWTYAVIFRVENFSVDDRTIISKWGSLAAEQFFGMRTDKSGGDTNIEVRWHGNTNYLKTLNAIELNTWYTAIIQLAGSGATDLQLRIYSVPGGALITQDSDSGSTTNKTTFAQEIEVGTRDSGGQDSMIGDIGPQIYIHASLSESERRLFINDPIGAAKQFEKLYGLAFYLPGLSDFEDHSLNGNAVSVNGDPKIGDYPPALRYSIDPTLQLARWAIPTAAAAAGHVPRHYTRRLAPLLAR